MGMLNETYYQDKQGLTKALAAVNANLDELNSAYEAACQLTGSKATTKEAREEFLANPIEYVQKLLTASITMDIPLEQKMRLTGINLSGFHHTCKGIDFSMGSWNGKKFILRKGIQTSIQEKHTCQIQNKQQALKLKSAREFCEAVNNFNDHAPFKGKYLQNATNNLLKKSEVGKYYISEDRLKAFIENA